MTQREFKPFTRESAFLGGLEHVHGRTILPLRTGQEMLILYNRAGHPSGLSTKDMELAIEEIMNGNVNRY